MVENEKNEILRE